MVSCISPKFGRARQYNQAAISTEGAVRQCHGFVRAEENKLSKRRFSGGRLDFRYRPHLKSSLTAYQIGRGATLFILLINSDCFATLKRYIFVDF